MSPRAGQRRKLRYRNKKLVGTSLTTHFVLLRVSEHPLTKLLLLSDYSGIPTMAKQKAPFDATQGSAVWAFDQFRSDALTSFLTDLLDAETSGFTAVQCDRTQTALRKIRIEAANIPDKTGWFGTSIAEEVHRFEKLYVEWNHSEHPTHAQAIKHRKRMWDKLVDSRHRISTRFRKNKEKIAQGLDLAPMKAFYGSLDSLAKALPEIFVNLSEATARFAKKLGT
jgi:hypothetical protein